MAPTNRILAYSKGLLENGATIDIINPFPSDLLKNNFRENDFGTYQGLKYKYISGRYKSRYKFFRAISFFSGYRKIRGYITTLQSIYMMNRIKKYDCIIISTDHIPTLFVFSIISRIIHAKSIFIFDEYPIPIRHKLKEKIPSWKNFLFKLVLNKIDAYISISEELKNYFCKRSMKKTLILPVIVDISRFEKKIDNTTVSKRKFLCYMGNMELSKDDVDNIIKAFSIIANSYTEIDLFLYGNPTTNSNIVLEKLIQDLGMQDRIFLKGKVSGFDVPDILLNAHILVSSQPDTIRASGGFPTKLGEYLSTGVPALLTNVGENANYVKENEHVFFAKPQDPLNYAEKLKYILDNYEFALQVAQKAKAFVFDNYSHIIQGKRLKDFISVLNKT